MTTDPLEQLKALAAADAAGYVIANADFPGIIAWAEGLQRENAELHWIRESEATCLLREVDLQQQLAEANAEIAQLRKHE